MHWVVANIPWIMLASGVLTSTMLYAAIAPQAALRSTFGETLQRQVADIVMRNWGALIGLVGCHANLWRVRSAGPALDSDDRGPQQTDLHWPRTGARGHNIWRIKPASPWASIL